MKKFINYFLNILIVIIIIAIAYLLWQNHLMKKEEIDNSLVALETYDTLTCTNDEVKADVSNPQVTNDSVNANEIIGYIMFPKVGESAALLQGDINDDQITAMERGVSHDPQSTMPGEPGNTVLAGHRELFFKHFLELEEGDDVILNVGNNVYIYKIDSIEIINADEAEKVFYANDEDLLVMYTCYPIEAWKWFTSRMVIKAKPIAKTTVQDCEVVTHQK